ncbi:predicted protein [Histoplasma capsulatum G186AR]|uniref:Uncharacterized protein n=1 Tax=Ajellomyces capsulatus (strain G186AR / H82 / ATCC MYA-2454 / RMSCC 2432) TaxID=447093 RepID=C0NSC9_AJECG|nr:uncharacterized protein HCBG_06059 [Histoplasma capsulatum G186AR]EEH05795.1 predicted protein [Histoplasma capsulatum G186AR]
MVAIRKRAFPGLFIPGKARCTQSITPLHAYDATGEDGEQNTISASSQLHVGRGAKILVAAGWSLYIALVVGILLVEERPQSKISSGTSGVSQLGRKDERAIGNQLAPAPLGSCAGYTPMASIGDRYGLMFVFSMQAPGAPTEPSSRGRLEGVQYHGELLSTMILASRISGLMPSPGIDAWLALEFNSVKEPSREAFLSIRSHACIPLEHILAISLHILDKAPNNF